MLINVLFFLSISQNIFADDRLIEVAQSADYQWNGVALTKTNRIFAVHFLDYTKMITLYLLRKFYRIRVLYQFLVVIGIHLIQQISSDNPEKRFVNINAILTDSNDYLWVVDCGYDWKRNISKCFKTC